MKDMPLEPGDHARVCINTYCSAFGPVTSPYYGSSPRDGLIVTGPHLDARTVTVRILMIGSDGMTLADSTIKTRLLKNQPNGAGCGPICYQNAVRLTASGQLETQ